MRRGDPGLITLRGLVASDEEAAAMCQVVDLVPAGDGGAIRVLRACDLR